MGGAEDTSSSVDFQVWKNVFQFFKFQVLSSKMRGREFFKLLKVSTLKF